MRDIPREAETQAEGEAVSKQWAQRGTRSWDSRITTWAKGGAKPLSHPGCPEYRFSKKENILELDSGDGLHNFVTMPKTTERYFKGGNFMVCEFYVKILKAMNWKFFSFHI